MFNRLRKHKKTSITEVDINRNESTLYILREHSSIIGEDRTLAIYVSIRAAERALHMIKKNKKISRGKRFVIEEFNFVEHKNSLVGL